MVGIIYHGFDEFKAGDGSSVGNSVSSISLQLFQTTIEVFVVIDVTGPLVGWGHSVHYCTTMNNFLDCLLAVVITEE